ncbi:hypothetical protein [Amycolatopsis sp. H20-H5]|uniref:hypothetical protein n=1 Tax=Amycolatopsis sp. H20-H5 TaxID=3046309 RepID=UPI002DBACB47|nr:hypothetical protein [Amycolatopsis sp. H20-H5]MEC3973932.1 hypothetical protein [Amycolatopsis sp. H20-H5]
MVVERAAPWLEGVVAAGHGKTADQLPDDASMENCGWCPLCAIVAVVRGERPEFAARLMEQAAQLVALLRAVLADRWEPEGGVHMPGFQPAPRPAREEREEAVGATTSARVQHIPVLRRGEWQPDRES